MLLENLLVLDMKSQLWEADLETARKILKQFQRLHSSQISILKKRERFMDIKPLVVSEKKAQLIL